MFIFSSIFISELQVKSPDTIHTVQRECQQMVLNLSFGGKQETTASRASGNAISLVNLDLNVSAGMEVESTQTQDFTCSDTIKGESFCFTGT